MKELLLRHGFNPGELTSARAVKSASSPRQIAPLYRDPVSGATWSGRGTEPNWIKGRDRETFKVAG